MASNDSIFGTFGAVLGYIGAEAATVQTFERLLWPQRSYSNFSAKSVLTSVLLMPMGGPLHKAALSVLDVFLVHGLFKGEQQGNMLGTDFFRQLPWTYTLHGDGKRHKSHSDSVRNCLWARVLTSMPYPMLDDRPSSSDSGSLEDAEKGARVAKNPPPPPLRARTVVSHLTLSSASAEDLSSSLPFVAEEVGIPGMRIFIAIFACELSAIATSLVVFLGFKSVWGLLWLVPLFLRLLSAGFALEREPLWSASTDSEDDLVCDFEVQCPQSEGSFMLITGPPKLVLQFFRHYGHPLRSRGREILQLSIIVAFACLFPIGLLVSVIWMPRSVQYTWLSYQLYVVLAMHVVRYSSAGRAMGTESNIATLLGHNATGSAANDPAILFGQKRNVAGLIKASVTNTYYGRYSDGKESMERLLSRHDMTEGN